MRAGASIADDLRTSTSHLVDSELDRVDRLSLRFNHFFKELVHATRQKMN